MKKFIHDPCKHNTFEEDTILAVYFCRFNYNHTSISLEEKLKEYDSYFDKQRK